MADVNIVRTIRIGDTSGAGINLAAIDASGRLSVGLNAVGSVVVPVSDNGGSLTIDGTVTANAGTGNFNIVGTGTAGTPAGGVLTVQGSGSGTALPISGTVTANLGTLNGAALETSLVKLTIAQSAALGSNTGAMVMGSVTTAAPTYTTGNIDPLSLTTAGSLRVDIGSNGTVAATQSGTWNITNITGTVTLPTGAATSANQTTEITSLQLLDNAVFATSTAAGTTDGGYNVLAVRKDTAAILAGVIDGDYTPLSVDATGRLWCNVSNTVTVSGTVAVTNGGTFVVQENGAALTALQLIDDTVFSDGAAAGSGKAVIVAGKDGSNNAQMLSTATDGSLNVNIVSGGAAGDSPTSPVAVYAATTDLAAGASTTTVHQTTDLGAGTYNCSGFDVAASVPLKAALHTVLAGVQSTDPVAVIFAPAGAHASWRPPHRQYAPFTSAGGGGADGFRVIITNLDGSEAANVYSTIYYQSN